MATRITAIYRYPVKGLSAERLERVVLTPGQCLPHDRRFAVALATTEFDPDRPQWLAKRHFVMLMRDEKLAELRTSFDPDSGELTIEHHGRPVLRAALTTAEGCRRIAAFLDEFLGPAVARPLRIISAHGHAFADARPIAGAGTDKYVSLINLASIAELENAIDAPADPLRFRANIYLDGAPAWAERDWLGRELRVGGARLRVIAEINRCAATEVNPDSAERDFDITRALERGFGHRLMGVYAEVVTGGEIARGDECVVLA